MMSTNKRLVWCKKSVDAQADNNGVIDANHARSRRGLEKWLKKNMGIKNLKNFLGLANIAIPFTALGK